MNRPQKHKNLRSKKVVSGGLLAILINFGINGEAILQKVVVLVSYDAHQILLMLWV